MPINFYKTKHNSDLKPKSPTEGMTLIELLVVLAIFMLVAGLTIFDYGKFRSNVSLQNLVDDVSLAIRRTQNYAIGVHSSQAVFSYGYGIHFSTAAPDSSNARAGSNKTFIIFTDLNANKAYDYPISSSIACNDNTLAVGDECIDMLNITSSDVINKICSNGINCEGRTTDISFLRPNPDATIYVDGIPVSSVSIMLRNIQSGDTKTITVSNTGQISSQ